KEIDYESLYKMNFEELKMMKTYLKINLQKRFITKSAFSFASSILIVKFDNKLRFCVKYRKLNVISKKNRYLISLIDEIMNRLSEVKIFIKLNIRQEFHRIRMKKDSKSLIIFRTRYELF